MGGKHITNFKSGYFVEDADKDKESLLPAYSATAHSPSWKSRIGSTTFRVACALTAIAAITATFRGSCTMKRSNAASRSYLPPPGSSLIVPPIPHRASAPKTSSDTQQCVNPTPLIPSYSKVLDSVYKSFESSEYRLKSAKVFSGALTYDTSSYDDMRGNGAPHTDPRYKEFIPFHEYLVKSFPSIHKTLKREIINDFSLLYTWEGLDPTAKPLMLEAHLDVVPINPVTLDQWKYPPFSGYFDGQYVWGRGSVDTKNSLIAILESVEALIKAGYTPEKTLLIAFGHDEEIGGLGGAKSIANHLVQKGYQNGIEMIVDEGFGVTEDSGNLVAIIGASEKGYVDMRVSVAVPGGHSSVPPEHTGIGILSKIVTEFEANQFYPSLTDDNALLQSFRCIQDNGGYLDEDLENALKNADKKRPELIDLLIEKSLRYKFMMQTSQAIDVINGGVKVNALPELSQFLVNHRVAIDSSIQEVVFRHFGLIAPIAEEFDLAVKVIIPDGDTGLVKEEFIYNNSVSKTFPSSSFSSPFGTVTIEVLPANSEPVPLTPIGTKAWNILGGTIRHVFQDSDDENLLVLPGLMIGNTDLRHMRVLTASTFSFGGGRARSSDDTGPAHTVNEFMSIDYHIGAVKFFYELIRNFNEQ